MENNRPIIYITLVALLFIIGIPTIINIKDNHNDKLYLTMKLKIIEAAKKCYLEDKCIDQNVKVSYLIDNSYLETVIDPISEEPINNDSYVIKKDNNIYEFYLIK